MGKKKSFYKKEVKPFLKGHQFLVSILTGISAGIAIAGILGTDKAKAIVQSVEDNIKELGEKVSGENVSGDRARTAVNKNGVS